MKLEITNQTSHPIPIAFLEKWWALLVKELKKEKTLKRKNLISCKECNLVFINKKNIKSLNKDYRGKNKATDVLSFEGDGFISLGEILLCYPVVKERARTYELPIKAYSAMLLTHGVLHLWGYDHELDHKEEKIMFDLQNKLCEKITSKIYPKFNGRLIL